VVINNNKPNGIWRRTRRWSERSLRLPTFGGASMPVAQRRALCCSFQQKCQVKRHQWYDADINMKCEEGFGHFVNLAPENPYPQITWFPLELSLDPCSIDDSERFHFCTSRQHNKSLKPTVDSLLRFSPRQSAA
jgi:hypothetical protein